MRAPLRAEAIAAAIRRQMERGRLPSEALYGDGHAGARIAELLAETWGQVGVKLQPQALDPDALTSVCCPTFDFDVIIWGWGSDPDPGFLLSVHLSYGYLWNEVRVKRGAYGVRASDDWGNGLFCLTRYR